MAITLRHVTLPYALAIELIPFAANAAATAAAKIANAFE